MRKFLRACRPLNGVTTLTRRLRRAVAEPLEERRLLATYLVSSAGHPGTLRQAILNANANANAGADTVEFSLPAHSTITLTGGPLSIGGVTAINGPGADRLTISGNNSGSSVSLARY